jgi:hypothetical protein
LRTRESSIPSRPPGSKALLVCFRLGDFFVKANLPIRVRYVGVFPKNGYREYDFLVEAEDKTIHQIILVIDDVVFLEKQLMFQEAPDLCYQKLRMNLIDETVAQIGARVRVTPLDVASYRDSHPSAKSRNKRS